MVDEFSIENVLRTSGIEISGATNPEDAELASRLKAKLKDELAAYASEKQRRTELKANFEQFRSAEREKIGVSGYQRRLAERTNPDLVRAVDTAESPVDVVKLAEPSELSKLFGRKANPNAASLLAKRDLLAYRFLRSAAQKQGLI